MKHLVIKDTREKDGWHFPESNVCQGTIDKKLDTGDYSLEGLEDFFVIERKASTGEFAQNINQKRFTKELERLDQFPYSFLVLEFTMEDLYLFPFNSGIPENKWHRLQVGPEYLVRRLIEIQSQYKTKVILAGNKGIYVAGSIFKRMLCMKNKKD